MNLKKLQKSIAENAITYGSLPFWSWNDKLNPEELRRQIARMDELGMRGFFMHARGGLETEYLSDDWYACVDACVDEAKKRGMEAWAYDENGWPSGFAGGILLEDERNWAHFLTLRECESFPEDAFAVYVKQGDGYLRVSEPKTDAERYYAIDRGNDSSYVDTFDADIIRRFLEETHVQYKQHVASADWGNSMPGFFTDEPQYFRYKTPWSDTFPRLWQEKYGADIKDGLIALFKTFAGSEIFRYDYHLMMHEQFINNYAKQIYDWCEENGCQLTGHAVEEGALHTQMWCCGGILPFYRYEHIPGIDYLGRYLSDDVPAKQLGSVCAQTGRKKALSEMFACCGWDVTPTELKKIAELQYVGGVNVMCQHLYAYSIRGQRKRDYPANYSEHLPWQDDMKAFDLYYNNLGYTISRGEELVNTLVLHPIRSCYLTYNREEDYRSVADVEDAFHALSNLLSEHQIPYHWGDESILRDLGSVKDGRITVGNCTYDYVVLPYAKTIDSTTAELLKEYLKQGGKLWLYADAPNRIDGRVADLSFLHATATFEDICAAAPSKITVDGKACPSLRQMVRITDEGRIFYIVNRSDNSFERVCVAPENCKGLVKLDMHTLLTEAVAFENGQAVISLEPAESVVLIETEEKAETVKPPLGKPIALSGAVFKIAEPITNMITLDSAYFSEDDGKTRGELLPVMAIKDLLLRRKFKGRGKLIFPFCLEQIPSTLKAVFEPLRGMCTEINGVAIESIEGEWWLDRSFRVADITTLVHVGENEFSISFDYFQRDYVYYVLYGGVSESLRNCLWFDTEIECMTLIGDFAVRLDPDKLTNDVKCSEIYKDTAFVLSAQKETIDLHDVVRDGYPFFGGRICAETKLIYQEGDPDELVLPGRYATIRVAVNGAPVTTLLFTNHVNLGGYLKEGENTIRLELVNAHRNLLGPHHCPDPEPWGVGPATFSCENSFREDGTSAQYVADRYSFVRFGIDY